MSPSILIKISILLACIFVSSVSAAAPMPWVCHAELAQEVIVHIEQETTMIPLVVVFSESDENFSVQSRSKAVSDAFDSILPGSLENICRVSDFFSQYQVQKLPALAVWSVKDPETGLTTTCSYICQDLKLEDKLKFDFEPTSLSEPLKNYLIKSAEKLFNTDFFRLY
jgi:hypothetical protein